MCAIVAQLSLARRTAFQPLSIAIPPLRMLQLIRQFRVTIIVVAGVTVAVTAVANRLSKMGAGDNESAIRRSGLAGAGLGVGWLVPYGRPIAVDRRSTARRGRPREALSQPGNRRPTSPPEVIRNSCIVAASVTAGRSGAESLKRRMA